VSITDEMFPLHRPRKDLRNDEGAEYHQFFGALTRARGLVASTVDQSYGGLPHARANCEYSREEEERAAISRTREASTFPLSGSCTSAFCLGTSIKLERIVNSPDSSMYTRGDFFGTLTRARVPLNRKQACASRWPYSSRFFESLKGNFRSP
jgi:hypothetical protein